MSDPTTVLVEVNQEMYEDLKRTFTKLVEVSIPGIDLEPLTIRHLIEQYETKRIRRNKRKEQRR